LKVLVSPYIGFCYGVKKAIDTLLSSFCPGKTATFGPLIHNPQVVSKLEKMGIRVVNSLSELKEGDTLVIPAQGPKSWVLEEALKKGIQVMDLTCPELKKTREMISRSILEGYQVLFLGDRGHSEVESLLSYFPSVRLVSPGETPRVPPGARVALFSQSTQDQFVLEKLADFLKSSGVSELQVFNTICRATRERQAALREILSQVEGLVVVGGKNSANTRRLASISQKLGKKTWQVEVKEELKREDFEGLSAIGVVSGASTPSETVEEVVRFLRSL
jgi:4-hydroxy-3-methylbut-2-enyl diphosphate reductase